VRVRARELQQFMFRYRDSKQPMCENELVVLTKVLTWTPVACNYTYYTYDPDTVVASKDGWRRARRNLGFHMSLRFTEGCEIELTSEHYEKLRFLGAIHRILLRRQLSPPRPSYKLVPVDKSAWAQFRDWMGW
jgi:hypothetical protein